MLESFLGYAYASDSSYTLNKSFLIFSVLAACAFFVRCIQVSPPDESIRIDHAAIITVLSRTFPTVFLRQL